MFRCMFKSLDLGCGRRPRAEICLDISPEKPIAVCSSTSQLDRFLEPYGFKYNPSSTIVKYDLNMGRIPFPDNCFERICAIHILEHLERPLDIVREAYRTLRPNGVFVAIVPNARKNNADWIDRTHIYSWTKPAFESFLSRVFSRVNVTTIVNSLDIMAVCVK